jgi:two-component system cell cycle sensor histidine kinase/response regulator CckA
MTSPQDTAAPPILVVDDEPVVLKLMERALAAAGWQVHAATGALQALEILAALPATPAVMVTDLRMEPIDGADLARLVAHQQPGIRILFVSGFLEDAGDRQLDRPILRKPFPPAALVVAVGRLMAEARAAPSAQP